MAKQKRRFIQLDWADPDALRAQDIPYDAADSIKDKIDAHDNAPAPHSGHVKTTGTETVDGIKTFGSFPVVPSSDPTTDYQVSTKKYVDDKTGAITHGSLSGLSNDDHPQYLLTSGNINEIASREHDQLQGLGDDDHFQYLNVVRHDSLNHSPVAGTIPHGSLASVGPDQHHGKQHAINGVDHSGDLAYQQLDSMVDLSGAGSANMISGAQHVHTGADGSSQVGHGSLSGVSASQHHSEFTPTQHDARDHTAVAGTISLAELGSRAHSQLTGIGANDHHGEFTTTQHDARDHSTVASSILLSELGAKPHSQLTNIGSSDHHAKYTAAEARADAVSDVAYGSSWNGITNIAPSKNAVYDKIQALGGGGSWHAISPLQVTYGTGSGSNQHDLSSWLPVGVKAAQFLCVADVISSTSGTPTVDIKISSASTPGPITDAYYKLSYVQTGAGVSIRTKDSQQSMVPAYGDRTFTVSIATSGWTINGWNVYLVGYVL